MNKRVKSSIIYAPKFVIFVVSVLNYLNIEAQIPRLTSGAAPSSCLYCAWFLTSKFDDVLIILAASIFLLTSKCWSYLIAILLSGYIVVHGLIFFLTRNMTMLEVWQFIRQNELDIFLQWEVQFILALIILSATIFYLVSETIDNKKLKSSLS